MTQKGLSGEAQIGEWLFHGRATRPGGRVSFARETVASQPQRLGGQMPARMTCNLFRESLQENLHISSLCRQIEVWRGGLLFLEGFRASPWGARLILG